MGVNQYSVLVGDPQEGQVSGPRGRAPALSDPGGADGSRFQVAVNIESDVGDSQVLFNIQTNFTPPNAESLRPVLLPLNYYR